MGMVDNSEQGGLQDENAYPRRGAADRPYAGGGGRRLRPVRRQGARSARQGRLSELVQPGGAGEAPAWRGDAALVLLFRGGKGLRGGRRGGQFLRHRGLGIRLDPDVKPAAGNRRPAQERAETGRASGREGAAT